MMSAFTRVVPVALMVVGLSACGGPAGSSDDFLDLLIDQGVDASYLEGVDVVETDRGYSVLSQIRMNCELQFVGDRDGAVVEKVNRMTLPTAVPVEGFEPGDLGAICDTDL